MFIHQKWAGGGLEQGLHLVAGSAVQLPICGSDSRYAGAQSKLDHPWGATLYMNQSPTEYLHLYQILACLPAYGDEVNSQCDFTVVAPYIRHGGWDLLCLQLLDTSS